MPVIGTHCWAQSDGYYLKMSVALVMAVRFQYHESVQRCFPWHWARPWAGWSQQESRADSLESRTGSSPQPQPDVLSVPGWEVKAGPGNQVPWNSSCPPGEDSYSIKMHPIMTLASQRRHLSETGTNQATHKKIQSWSILFPLVTQTNAHYQIPSHRRRTWKSPELSTLLLCSVHKDGSEGCCGIIVRETLHITW